MAKYKVIKDGFSSNGSPLLTGQVFEGSDKGEKFLDQPAFTITFLGRSVAVPKTYFQEVDANTPITDQSVIVKYNTGLKTASQVGQLAGIGALSFVAYRRGVGLWGYIGFGILGIIAGAFVGKKIYRIFASKMPKIEGEKIKTPATAKPTNGKLDDSIITKMKELQKTSTPPKTLTPQGEQQIRAGLSTFSDKEKKFVYDMIGSMADLMKGIDTKSPDFFEKFLKKSEELSNTLKKKYGNDFAEATKAKMDLTFPETSNFNG